MKLDHDKAVGLLEVDGVCAAFAAIDIAAKTGQVSVESIERTRYGCRVCIKVRGDVSSVKAAMEASAKVATEVAKVANYTVIPAPTGDIEKMILYSDI